MKSIPFFSFHNAPQSLKCEWLQAIEDCINEGVFIRGGQVELFERNWAAVNGVGYALGVSNGQDALILALRALGIKAGDKVAVPAHTFIATHNAIVEVGATPVSVDVNQYGLLSAEALEGIKPRPNALIAVHMHGMMCEMDQIIEWAKSNKVLVVEDCSQAHLANQKGALAGTLGDIGVFSCYPTKNLGALGDAGVVITNSQALYEKMKSLGNYGSNLQNKYEHKEFGLNNRLDEIQAAVLNVNLKYLSKWNERRREIAAQYYEGLKDLEIEFLQPLFPNNVWHHFCILTENRDLLREKLLHLGIHTEIHYPKLAATECESYAGLQSGQYPIANILASKTLSLPISQWHKDQDILQVISALRSVL